MIIAGRRTKELMKKSIFPYFVKNKKYAAFYLDNPNALGTNFVRIFTMHLQCSWNQLCKNI